MRLLRAVAGAALWILGGVLGLLAVLLCLTVILLPVGIPLLRLARRTLTTAVRLMLPRRVAHPIDESTKALTRRARGSAKKLRKAKKRGKRDIRRRWRAR
ncbi:MAG TPA: hypothetical protein VI452_06185 [Marmoricola sp.]